MVKLHELKNKRSELVAKMRGLAEKDEDLNEGEVSEFDALKSQVASLDSRISRVEDVIAAQAEAAEPVSDDGSDAGDGDEGDGGTEEAEFEPVIKRLPRPSGRRMTGEPLQIPEEKGFKAARFMVGLWHAKGGMGMNGAADYIERRFRDKQVAKALNTAGVATGGALIPQAFSQELIELLRADTVIRGSNPLMLPMPMGNLTIPRLAAGATAGYLGELDDIAVSQETFDDLQLNAKKLTALVPVSNDLIRRSPIGVEGLIRDDLVQTLARREDLAFMVGDGSGNSPIGLLNLCAAGSKLTVAAFADNTAATAVNTAVAVLSTMQLTLRNNFSRMIRPVWIMAPQVFSFLTTLRDGIGNLFQYAEEMLERNTLMSIPVKVSQQIPTNLNTGTQGSPINNGSYLFLADFADVIIADTYNVNVDASDVASYKDGGGNTVSAYQRDQTSFRVITEHDFNIRHQASVAIAVLPAWAPAGYTTFGPGGAYFVQAPSGDSSAAPSTWGTASPTGSNNPGNSSATVAGGTLPGRP